MAVEESASAARRERALVLALLLSLVLWNLPFGGALLYPFKLFATWLHEMAHGLTMLVGGAGFSHLEIFADTSGIAYAERGVGPVVRAAIASAGYMGASLLGAVFLVLGQSGVAARRLLAALGGALLLSLVFWVKNDVGMAAVGIGAAICLVGALVAPRGATVVVVNFIAAQACSNAVLDIRVLFRSQLIIDGEVVGTSDAHNMAAATFGNHYLWATVWLAWSLLCFFVALRVIKQRAPTLAADHTVAVATAPSVAEAATEVAAETASATELT